MMYSPTDLVIITNPYFNVLRIEEEFLEIQSKNTGHYWLIEDKRDYIELYHRYPGNENYHYQTSFGIIEDALLNIALHDDYKIYGKRHEMYTRGTETFYDFILKQYTDSKSIS